MCAHSSQKLWCGEVAKIAQHDISRKKTSKKNGKLWLWCKQITTKAKQEGQLIKMLG
jgi:hypothetical protein